MKPGINSRSKMGKAIGIKKHAVKNQWFKEETTRENRKLIETNEKESTNTEISGMQWK
jgi:hypothetical protein